MMLVLMMVNGNNDDNETKEKERSNELASRNNIIRYACKDKRSTSLYSYFYSYYEHSKSVLKVPSHPS